MVCEMHCMRVVDCVVAAALHASVAVSVSLVPVVVREKCGVSCH